MTSANTEYPIRLEVAFDADPSDPDTWTWTDLSDDLVDQTVVIKRGRADEASTPAATSVKFVLDNQTGDYTPTRRDSIHYPYIRRGVPIRFSVWYEDAWEVRFVGFAESWTPTWPHGDLSDGDYLGESFVTIDAAGPLRRLAQNSAIVLDAAASSVVARWGEPNTVLYQGTEATVEGVNPLTWVPGFLSPRVVGNVPTHPNPTVFTAWGQHYCPSLAVYGNWNALDVRTSGFVWRWLVTVSGTSVNLYRATTASGLTLVGSSPNLAPFDGIRRVALSVTQTTSNQVTWRLIYTHGDQPENGNHIADVTGTISNTPCPLGRVTQVFCDAGAIEFSTASGYGNFAPTELAVTTGDMDWGDDGTGINWNGERAGRRIERIAGLYDVPFTAVGDLDETQVLSEQKTAGPAEIILDAAKVDLGVLSEDVDGPGLTYRCREYNRSVAAALVAADDLLDPFVPVLDDQRYRNRVSVTPAVGGKAVVSDDDLIALDGIREDSLSLTVPDTQQAREQAGWRLRLASGDEMRYPTVTAEMSDQWLAITPGDRVTVSGLPPQHPDDDADLIIEGWTETITNVRWTIQANCSPAVPWDIATVGTAQIEVDDVTVDDLVSQVARITTAGHYLSAPDAVPLDIVGDLDLRWDGALTDWTAAADQVLVAKWNSFGVNQRSYRLYLSTTGVPTLTWSTNGTATVTATATAALPTANGDRVRVRATLDVDDGAGNRVIRFYTSTSFDTPLETETDWTQLGSTVTAAGTTSIHSGTGSLAVGAVISATPGLLGAIGDHYAAAVLSGIAGTVVANPDFTDPAQTTVGATTATDTHGNVFTLTGADVDIVAHHRAWVDGVSFDSGAVPFDLLLDGYDPVTVTAVDGRELAVTRTSDDLHVPGVAVTVAAPLIPAL